MDGTIANLYGVNGWLEDLLNENARPYEIAATMHNMSHLARLLHKAQKNGYKIGIISWLAKDSTANYDTKVTTAKIKWLETHLKSVEWDYIEIKRYGYKKSNVSSGMDILFDDEKANRIEWATKGNNLAFTPDKIITVLSGLR